MPELSRFEYPDGPCMYDPVLQLSVSVDTGSQWEPVLPMRLGMYIRHDPEIVQGRYTMPRRLMCSTAEIELYRKLNQLHRLDELVPFFSARKQVVTSLRCFAHDCGDVIRLKVYGNHFEFRCYDMRGRIEQMNIPKVSTDVSSMYVGVMKAFVRLPALHREFFTPHWFPHATTVEICVTTSALTGLDRSPQDYPMTEDGWHCLATSARLFGSP
jgi:hypothetical protein